MTFITLTHLRNMGELYTIKVNPKHISATWEDSELPGFVWIAVAGLNFTIHAKIKLTELLEILEA